MLSGCSEHERVMIYPEGMIGVPSKDNVDVFSKCCATFKFFQNFKVPYASVPIFEILKKI